MKSVLISLGLAIAGAGVALAQGGPPIASVSGELTCKQKAGGPNIVSSGNVTFVMVGSPFAALTQDIAPILAQVVKRSGPPPGTDVGTYGTAANIETLNIPCSAAQAVANAYALFSCTLGFSSYDAFSFADFFNRFLKRTGLSTPTTTLVLPNGYLFSQWNYVCLTE